VVEVFEKVHVYAFIVASHFIGYRWRNLSGECSPSLSAIPDNALWPGA
jgi:hypothetical protein